MNMQAIVPFRLFIRSARRGMRAAGWTVCLALVFCCSGRAGASPSVNGLFYGDSDYSRYPATPYAISSNGSPLYVVYVNGTIYVALVVSRNVNDNAFDSGLTAYMQSADWEQTPTTAGHRCNSEFAEFTLEVVSGATTNSWNWQQGYAGQKGGGAPETRNNRTLATWRSDTTVSGGLGSAPPGMVSASSMMWNMNTYATMLAGGTNTWTMPGLDANSANWKSPWNPTNSNTVVNDVEGYPATGQITYSPTYRWEWPMVYEWAVDLTQFGASPIFVLTGSSHHSPQKMSLDTDDPFPIDPKPLMDFGDLPDIYNTTTNANGARHIIDPVGARLGASLDSEVNGAPHPLALGDDLTGVDDDDGVELLTPLIPGNTAVLQITIGSPGYLSAFIDWDGNGMLDTVTVVSVTGPTNVLTGTLGDTLFASNGVYDVTISVPANAAGAMPARFRITNASGEGGNSTLGLAQSGEVEDYIWTVAIGDYVWVDTNGDGIQDAGEPGLANVMVRLYDAASNLVATALTDAAGGYAFTNLLSETYYVQTVSPTGYTNTVAGAGGDPAVDSDGNAAGWSGAVTVYPGETRNDIDFGFFIPARLYGYAYWDKDLSLTRSAGDGSASGMVVQVWLDGVLVASTNANAAGYYEFNELVPGTYEVRFFGNTQYLTAIPMEGDAATDPERNRAAATDQGYALVTYDVYSGHGIGDDAGEPVNAGFTGGGPLSSGIDLRAYQGADGVYVEFVAYDVEEDGTITLYLLGPDGRVIWSRTAEVEAGPRQVSRFRVPGLVLGGRYDFVVRDEVGKIWRAPGVTVGEFAAEMIRMSLAGVTLSFNSLPEREYEIQWTARLGTPWRTVTNVPSQGDRTSVVVVHPDPGSPSGFFRIRVR